MKKVILWVCALLVISILGILGFAATKPGTFHIKRTVAIPAPPDAIFPLINDLRQWARWSPYEKLDPAMKKTFSGSESGKGAVYAWDGNSKAGAGRMEVTESIPPTKIVFALHFTRPFEGNNTSEFTLEPDGESTNVTWAMYGPMHFVAKVMSVFVDMDAMLGKQFTEGLANLKSQVRQ
jgi:uncharacterized protein YndB with AHSA1/START domain